MRSLDIFVFTSLIACAIFYIFLLTLVIKVYPSYVVILVGFVSFLFGGTALIEWVSKYI